VNDSVGPGGSVNYGTVDLLLHIPKEDDFQFKTLSLDVFFMDKKSHSGIKYVRINSKWMFLFYL